jgi:UbiD family decarboxylase
MISCFNCALQRCFVKRSDNICIHVTEGTHNWYNVMKFWKMGQDAPAAVWIGHHPAVFLGANVKTSYPEDHYPYAGGLLGERLRIVPTESCGDARRVPADAEAEGPFGEYHGYEGPQRPSMAMDVTAVSH